MPYIYGIELTNHCNLKCSYCPSPVSLRPKGIMTEATYLKILDYISNSGQRLLVLHLFGEPLLHPHLEHFISLATKRGFLPGFSTNGIILTECKVKALVEAGLRWMCISLHNEKALEIANQISSFAVKENCIIFARSFNDNPFYPNKGIFVENITKHDFSGTAPDRTVRGRPLRGHLKCDFIQKNYFSLHYDGKVVACCMDESGATNRGCIDQIDKIRHIPKYELCLNCEGMQFHRLFIWQERFLKACVIAGNFSLGKRLINNAQRLQLLVHRLFGIQIPDVFVYQLSYWMLLLRMRKVR